MAIVRRKSAKTGKVYYFNTTTSKFSSEDAWKRSNSSSKKAKTQFKTSRGYACSSAGRDLKVKHTSSAGRRLRKCAN